MSEFKSSQRVEGQNLVLSFEGTIDEDVAFPAIDLKGAQQVVLDLQGVRTINSVGIREWLNWITPLSEKTDLVLKNCPKALVFQFNMVEGFLPARAKVVSFYVPYYCEKCDKEENVLFTTGQDVVSDDGRVVVNKKVQSGCNCADGDCGLEMDVTEAKYFQFVKKQSA